MTEPTQDEADNLRRLHDAYGRLTREISKVIVGQRSVIDELMVALFARSHCLLIGVPGLAKTLLIRSFAEAVSLDFSRIQFTPDLMPADITGTEVIQEDRQSGTRELRFIRGPIFANVILADEINRTPPKTQAALLESMQERQVTVAGVRHELPEPFFVLATQNPIEQEGTYPLPEAQLDRFMLNVYVDYPDEEEERQIVRQTTAKQTAHIEPVLSAEDIAVYQAAVRSIPVAEHVLAYAVRLARATRRENPQAPDFVKEYVAYGAGPRGSQNLILGAKALAALRGRHLVTIDDVQALAVPVLRHRVVTNFNARAAGLGPADVIERIIQITPTDEATSGGSLPELFRSAGTR
jgi:MoxR-like ATPase